MKINLVTIPDLFSGQVQLMPFWLVSFYLALFASHGKLDVLWMVGVVLFQNHLVLGQTHSMTIPKLYKIIFFFVKFFKPV